MRTGLLVLEDQSALVNDDGGNGFQSLLGRTGQAVDIPRTVAAADDAQARPLQLDLANAEDAVEKLLLIVIDDAGGDVQKFAVFRIVLARQAQLAEADAAEDVPAPESRVTTAPGNMACSFSMTCWRTTAGLVQYWYSQTAQPMPPRMVKTRPRTIHFRQAMA